MGHTDVVPVNADGWSRDPFGGELVDGMVWGRGAVDMLNLTASHGRRVPPPRRLRVQAQGHAHRTSPSPTRRRSAPGARSWLVDHERDAVYADYVLTESGGFQMPTPERARASR